MSIYLIKRGPKPDYHKAPFHPVIVCGKKRVAKEEAGWTGDRAWVWERSQGNNDGEGWLLVRWNGYDIDYGHLVRGFGPLPDGTPEIMVHPHTGEEPWTLLQGAIWWDDRKMPKGMQELGAVYPCDEFTQQWILDRVADDGASGFGRVVPPWWVQVSPELDTKTERP